MPFHLCVLLTHKYSQSIIRLRRIRLVRILVHTTDNCGACVKDLMKNTQLFLSDRSQILIILSQKNFYYKLFYLVLLL